MCRLLQAVTVTTFVLLWPYQGASQENALTLDRALTLARERAPTILAAQARIEEARGRLAGASVYLRDNPRIETAAGRRRTSEEGRREDSADVEVGVSQTFELGGRRSARIAGAEAAVTRETAAGEDVARRLLRDVAIAFVRTLHAEERLRLITAAENVAADLLRTAQQRYHAGDIAALDLNVAISAAARAHADRLTAEAARQTACGELRVLLGMSADEPLAVRGDLHNRRRYTLSELLARAASRPDLRALAAEVQEAQAEVRLGEGFTWPDVSLGFRYHREKGTEHIALGTLSFTLPAFARGQELRATGEARARRLRQELEAGRRAVDTEIQTTFAVYRHRTEAVEALERNALPVLDDNEALARRSYEVGRMSLVEFLLIRREIGDTRLTYVDRLLEAVLAGIELEARAGALQ
jgi:cobalt-zinc-cadmium efflux system outer membrane protein